MEGSNTDESTHYADASSESESASDDLKQFSQAPNAALSVENPAKEEKTKCSDLLPSRSTLLVVMKAVAILIFISWYDSLSLLFNRQDFSLRLLDLSAISIQACSLLSVFF
jgi:hypothetical protein